MDRKELIAPPTLKDALALIADESVELANLTFAVVYVVATVAALVQMSVIN